MSEHNDSIKIVTAALPYANGSIHLGHLVEYIQTDIFVRAQKMKGVNALYFCADDTHGAPIMIRAKNEGTTPEAVIERYNKEHQEDFADFFIEFDNYHSTNSEENRLLSEEIFLKLKNSGHITVRDVEQAYCENDKMFLPDRFVRGKCPKCGSDDQYGDACDACGSHYSSTDLKKPKCSICGQTPVRKVSSHYFFEVSNFAETLKEFMEGDALQDEVKNFLNTWVKEGLKDWDISRDGPYFGFKIPGEENKYFYVWLDAPVGYIASAQNWAEKNGRNLQTLWGGDGTEIHHFIGKDIMYFHTLFWIPMLKGAGFKLPAKIHVHGFLTVNGEKMSKSKGTFILARDYLKRLDPECLRYYYAGKLKNSIGDLDLNFQDFLFRVNAELVNKIANLGSRTISILNKNKALKNKIGVIGPSEKAMLDEMRGVSDEIFKLYDSCEFSQAIKKIVAMADVANEFIDRTAPWGLKDEPERQREVLTAGINAFRLITLYLKPVTPKFAEKVERILNIEPFTWSDSESLLENHQIGKFERLKNRIEMKPIEELIEATRGVEASTDVKASKTENKKDEEIEFDDFLKVDLRTAKVVTAEKVEKADKLLKLTLNLAGEERIVVAGIALSYAPEELVGKTIVVVANLKPRKLRGIMSQGMVLAVNDGDKLTLVGPMDEIGSGIRVS